MQSTTTTSRAERERARYNEGLRRSRYEAVLGHTRFLYNRRQAEIRDAILRHGEGRRVLELGSYSWTPWIEKRGHAPAELHCINISEAELEIGRKRAVGKRVQPIFHLMDAHELQFEDQSFDVVFGNAILHHLDFERALREVRRVVRPDGRMLFLEPLAINPVAKLVRLLTPQARTEDEQPLRLVELRLLRKYFDCVFHYEQFLTVPAGVLSGMLFSKPDNVLMAAALRADVLLERAVPFLRPMYRQVLVEGRPKPA